MLYLFSHALYVKWVSSDHSDNTFFSLKMITQGKSYSLSCNCLFLKAFSSALWALHFLILIRSFHSAHSKCNYDDLEFNLSADLPYSIRHSCHLCKPWHIVSLACGSAVKWISVSGLLAYSCLSNIYISLFQYSMTVMIYISCDFISYVCV